MARTDKLAETHERLTRAVEEIVSGEESEADASRRRPIPPLLNWRRWRIRTV